LYIFCTVWEAKWEAKWVDDILKLFEEKQRKQKGEKAKKPIYINNL
jgi:hypothetical protein